MRNIRWRGVGLTCRNPYIDEKKDNHHHPGMVLAHIAIRRDAFDIALLAQDIYLSVCGRTLLHRNEYVYLFICSIILIMKFIYYVLFYLDLVPRWVDNMRGSGCILGYWHLPPGFMFGPYAWQYNPLQH